MFTPVSLVKNKPFYMSNGVSLTKRPRQRVSLVREHPRNKDILDSNLIEGFVRAWSARGHDLDFRSTQAQLDFHYFVEARSDGGLEYLAFCTECSVPHDKEEEGLNDGYDFYCSNCSQHVDRCENCSAINDRDNLTAVRGGDLVCENCCAANYSSCNDCDEYVKDDDVSRIDDETVCDRCRDRSYIFCDDCNEYYHENSGHEHEHDNDCECDSPEPTFALHQDGADPLYSDAKVTVTLPTGFIDDQGFRRIRARLQQDGQWVAADLLLSLDRRWQTREGNFTKRLSRALYKKTGTKLDPALVSAVGNIAREHSSGTAEYKVSFTRELNGAAGDFYHDDSCWWGGYAESRCALKSNGGIGMRTWGNGRYVSGRAWVMPLKRVIVETHQLTIPGAPRLEPTFETEYPDAWIVFNGYGELAGYAAARVMAQLSGMTYRKVEFNCEPMFVNGDSGYLIAPEDLASKYTDGRLNLAVEKHSSLSYAERAMRALRPVDTTPETVNA
jgi:hypothetical protein